MIPIAESNRAIRYTERLAEAAAVASVGSKGDSYDNAMAEAFNSLFKAECIRNPLMRPKGGWKSVGDVELAVAEYVDWFNHRRLHGELGQVPPAEFEANHWSLQGITHYVEPRPQQGPEPSNRAFTKPGAIHPSAARAGPPPRSTTTPDPLCAPQSRAASLDYEAPADTSSVLPRSSSFRGFRPSTRPGPFYPPHRGHSDSNRRPRQDLLRQKESRRNVHSRSCPLPKLYAASNNVSHASSSST